MANPADIVDIIQVPALIKDEFIKAGKVILDHRQNPIHYTGGFAIVFPFLVNNDKWAFRCWYNSVGNIGTRLQILSDQLKRISLPYFCQFHYTEKGIVLDGNIRPTTRMKWIDGLNIKDYICKNAYDKPKLLGLASSFKQMCTDLHKAKIAHGDLQHGNIMVGNDGKLYLIDYDSLYLPALEGEKDIITGLSAYQHPSRINGNNKYAHEKLDYFSELIIYLSIIAISEVPSLIKDYDVIDGDNLLFRKEDYLNLEHSKIYRALIKQSDEVKGLLNILVDYLKENDIRKLTSFEKLIIDSIESRFCTICGSEYYSAEDKFCFKCGARRI